MEIIFSDGFKEKRIFHNLSQEVFEEILDFAKKKMEAEYDFE